MIFFAWLARTARHISQISPAEAIAPRAQKALLLINLQTVFWESDFYDQSSRETVLKTVQDRAAQAHKNGDAVIAIRQEWSETSTRLVARLFMAGAGLAGSPGIETAKPFAHLPTHQLSKRVQDAFETGELDKLLSSLQVGSLEIVGLDGEYCVARTAESALNRAYQVGLITAGIATAKAHKIGPIYKRLGHLGATIIRPANDSS